MILLQPSLVWCYIIINWGILWNTALLCSRSYWRFKFSLNLWLCGWCLLNGETFCSQTWYDDVSSWAGVSCRRLLFCFQGHGHSEVLHHPDITIWTVFWTTKPFALTLSPVSSRSRSEWWFKTFLNVLHTCVFCIIDLFAMKLGMLIHNCKNRPRQVRVICFAYAVWSDNPHYPSEEKQQPIKTNNRTECNKTQYSTRL